MLVIAAPFFYGLRSYTLSPSAKYPGIRSFAPALVYNGAWLDLDNAMAWVNAHARPADLVVSSVPGWVYLNTGHRAIMPPFEDGRAVQDRLLDSTGARFVIVETMQGTSMTSDYLQGVLVPPKWELCLGQPDSTIRVYERVANN